MSKGGRIECWKKQHQKWQLQEGVSIEKSEELQNEVSFMDITWHVDMSNKERKQQPCSRKTRKGECSFVFLMLLFKQVTLSQFKHMSVQISVQASLDAELEHPRPHTGEDCGHKNVDAHGCPCAPTFMWPTRLRPGLRLGIGTLFGFGHFDCACTEMPLPKWLQSLHVVWIQILTNHVRHSPLRA